MSGEQLGVGWGGGVMVGRVRPADIFADGREGFDLLLPVSRAIEFSAGARRKVLEGVVQNGVLHRIPAGDYINRNAFVLGDAADVIGADRTRRIGTIGEY